MLTLQQLIFYWFALAINILEDFITEDLKSAFMGRGLKNGRFYRGKKISNNTSCTIKYDVTWGDIRNKLRTRSERMPKFISDYEGASIGNINIVYKVHFKGLSYTYAPEYTIICGSSPFARKHSFDIWGRDAKSITAALETKISQHKNK
jgi:hypothetical protein